MIDAEFLAALESGTLPEPEFNHAGHVRAAWLYLQQGAFPEALARMSGALRTTPPSMASPTATTRPSRWPIWP